MPPAASTGVGATASTTSGTSTIVPISPVWPPASEPWAMIEVDAGGLLALGVDDGADERGDQDAALVGLGDEEVAAAGRGRWRRA